MWRQTYRSALVRVMASCLFSTKPFNYLNQCWFTVNWTLGTKYQSTSNQITIIFERNRFQNIVCKVSAIVFRSRRVIIHCLKHVVVLLNKQWIQWWLHCLSFDKNQDYVTIYLFSKLYRVFLFLVILCICHLRNSHIKRSRINLLWINIVSLIEIKIATGGTTKTFPPLHTSYSTTSVAYIEEFSEVFVKATHSYFELMYNATSPSVYIEHHPKLSQSDNVA